MACSARLQAAHWFAQDMPASEIAQRLRVSTNAVYVWRRRWRAGGTAALVSKGSGGSACRLDEQRLDLLAQAVCAAFKPRPRAVLARLDNCQRNQVTI